MYRMRNEYGEHFVTCGEMKLLERRGDEAGLSYYQMMENAGTQAAKMIRAYCEMTGVKPDEGEDLAKPLLRRLWSIVLRWRTGIKELGSMIHRKR